MRERQHPGVRFWVGLSRKRTLGPEDVALARRELIQDQQLGLAGQMGRKRAVESAEPNSVSAVIETQASGGAILSNLVQELRYGLRTLAKTPGVTAVAVVALALGIGANTVIFTNVNAMLLRPFSLQYPDRTVAVWETVPQQNQQSVGPAAANFQDWSEQSKGFDLLAAGHGWDVNLTGKDVAERVEGYQVTANFFALLGIPAEFGRTIGTADFGPGRTSVIVLSHGFWQRHLGADPGIVGRNLLLNGRKFTVIGVMPADFDFPIGVEAWAPLDLSVEERADRANHYLQVIGRLKHGVSVAQAQADLQTISISLAKQYPQTNAGHSARVVGLVEDLTTGSRQFIIVLMGAAAFVLLLACANVANLLLARTTGRQKEIAVRIALGASRGQIARQLLIESTLVALLGGLLGLQFSSWGLDAARRSIPPFIVQHIVGLKHLRIDSTVLVFTFLVALVTGVLAGLAPALQISRPDLNDVLKEGARGGSQSPTRRRLRALLVMSEVALALVLLVGAGLMVRGFRQLATEEMGFDRHGVLTFRIALAESKYGSPDRIRDFYRQAVEKLSSLPGVESAAAVTSVPGSWSRNYTQYSGEGQPPAAPGELRSTIEQSVTPDFFHALRVPLVKGRLLDTRDGPNAPLVVVVSQNLARRVWPIQDAVGKRIKFGRAEGNEAWRTVVGVVGDIKQYQWDQETHLVTYFPFAQLPQASSTLMMRTHGDPVAMAGAARARVLSVDPDQPPYDIRTLEQLIADDVSGVEASANMMIAFGVVALALAAAGIFAVIAYSVRQRTHEIGVRMALGAQNNDVVRLVVGYALKLAAIGLAIGVPCALALTHALTSFLFGIIRIDALTFGALTILLVLTAALAAYVPARWATNIDPLVALRYE